jgi:putative ABC transport system substrate-binding protein
MQGLGYVEGRNLMLEFRDAEGQSDRLPALAAELVSLKVDVIVAGATTQALAAQKATKTIPIVFFASDPISSGLVTNLARPGGNLTGISSLGPDLVGKSLDVLNQAVPGLRSIGVLWHPGVSGDPTAKNMLAQARAAGRTLGVRLHFAEVRGPADFERAFSQMAQARAGAVVVLPNAELATHGPRLTDLAARKKLPALYLSMQEIVRVGGLMSYGADSRALVPHMATYVDKILKGARPGELPVEQPTKFELVINLKAAKAIGLKIPPSLLQRADQVIQ